MFSVSCHVDLEGIKGNVWAPVPLFVDLFAEGTLAQAFSDACSQNFKTSSQLEKDL